MKYAVMAAVFLLTGCLSAQKVDRDAAYARCQSIGQKTSRDKCIAKAVQEAERERQRVVERTVQQEADAEARELERAKAGIEED